jgi:hypothetical protein
LYSIKLQASLSPLHALIIFKECKMLYFSAKHTLNLMITNISLSSYPYHLSKKISINN